MLSTPTKSAVRDGGPPSVAPPRPRTDRYERPVLSGIAVLAAFLTLWGLDHSSYHGFYAAAVRSMTDNPVAFFYGSFDPGNSLTIDKLPGFLWPQALSALVFGFHPWALVVPQALETVASVILLHVLVRRWAGVPAGLLAAAFLALTPVMVGLGRSVTEDAPFVLLLLLAAEAVQRAAERGRTGPLLLAGFWVGVAFQCKMLEAWAVLPALAGTYLVAAPRSLRRRLRDLAWAAVVTFAVSVSWMLVATLTPGSARPYLDGTTDDSAFGLVVGYNFLTRFHAVGIDAAGTGSVVPNEILRVAGTSPGMGNSTWKMFSPGLATQTGWLYPLAAFGLAGGAAALWRRRAARTDRALAGQVLWGVWLATFFLVFSFGSVTGHTYYMGVVAVPLAAFAAVGVVRARRAGLRGGRRIWVLPGALAVNTAWCVALTLWYPRFFPWSAPIAAALAVAALALTAIRRRPRLVTAGLAVGLTAVLCVPAVWSASALSQRYNQPGSLARVGPSSHRPGNPLARLDPDRRRLLAYLTAHRHGAEYLAAIPGWWSAAPFIISADAHVLPMGGFTGQVPYPSSARFHRLLDTGRLRYVVLSATDIHRGRRHRDTTLVGGLERWTAGHCALVPAAAYGSRGRSRVVLYDCGGHLRR
ncbi:ArnT family glycosyltransferase [Streptomyces tropicalis]|uniref:Glycosyltransferase family 39 protein n=1 Tax=Streptomyces tropicalis TaxID=3034234 RepID=A0ABT6A6C6_9ACTN|nr:glycosyltransferase family 39 protein [Streptomyces tropicalis]MDF3300189.1 glycosyltransferase family 39 protein [Streptomyces tropicalis]